MGRVSKGRASKAGASQGRASKAGASQGRAFWRFSLLFYALPGVSPALIALQDRDGTDVNLALFALWLGASGRGRLTPVGLAAAERSVATIRAEIVVPLRRVRRRLRTEPAADLQSLRARVQAVELAAERTAQLRLAAVAGPVVERRSSHRIADGEANLALLLGPRAESVEAGALRRAFAAFLGG